MVALDFICVVVLAVGLHVDVHHCELVRTDLQRQLFDSGQNPVGNKSKLRDVYGAICKGCTTVG